MTDISQFYPSLYTHTVPWALHTKAVAKTNRGSGLLGNRLDTALRNVNDGQTLGVPIGPDTSLVTAEVLMSSVDQALIARHTHPIKGFRYIDDYELSFGSRAEAEDVLSHLQTILASYELNLNPRKTQILELPLALDTPWAIDLRNAPLRDSTTPVGQRNDIIALFSKAFDHARTHPEDPVLRYACARVRGLDVHAKAWRVFQNCVLGAAAADGSVIPTAVGALFEAGQRSGHPIAIGPLTEMCERVVHTHAPKAHGSEVGWAMWTALAWQLHLSGEVAHLLGQMEDDIVAIMAMDADSRGLFPTGTLTTNAWSIVAAQPDVLSSEHWLMAYEADVRGWLSTPSLNGDPTFASMRSAGVSFYDPRQCVPQAPTAGYGFPGGSVPDNYA